jgi:hypothetical protein
MNDNEDDDDDKDGATTTLWITCVVLAFGNCLFLSIGTSILLQCVESRVVLSPPVSEEERRARRLVYGFWKRRL